MCRVRHGSIDGVRDTRDTTRINMRTRGVELYEEMQLVVVAVLRPVRNRVTFTCLEVALVAVSFCALFALVEVTICLFWTLISIIFCLSKAQGGTAFLLTDGTVMMQEFKSINAYYLGCRC